MFAKNLSITIVLVALLFGACSSESDKSWHISDIIGARVVKKLLNNIPLNREFEKTLVGFGYRQGANCIQQIEETSPSGAKRNVVRFFRTTCTNFPIETEPLGELRLVLRRVDEKQVIYYGSLLVGEVDADGAITDLCFNSYANRCDLVLADDGSISTFRAKSGREEWPVITANSVMERAVLWIVNNYEEEELIEAGLTEDETSAVLMFRTRIRDYESFDEIRDRGEVSSASVSMLVDHVAFSGLATVLTDLRSFAASVVVINECSHPVRIAIRTINESLKWEVRGWWNFAAGETARLNKFSTLTDTLFIYAETTDTANMKWAGSEHFVFDGKKYPFKPWKTYRSSREKSAIKLTCGQ